MENSDSHKVAFEEALRCLSEFKMSVVFHVVNISLHLNKMVVNTNCKESSVQLLCQMITLDDVQCVIFCEELVTRAGKDTCQLSFQRTNTKKRHRLMLLWFTDLMNVTEEVTIHRPNVSTLLSSAFVSGDLNTATRGPFI